MRIRKFVRRDIQLKLTLWFAAISAFALVFQFVLMLNTMSGISAEASNAANQQQIFLDAALKTLGLSLGVVLPLTVVVGVLTTFRIAGPIYRFTEFLKETRAGKRPADCVIRKGDELQDFVQLLNEVTQPLRRPAGEQHDDPGKAAA